MKVLLYSLLFFSLPLFAQTKTAIDIKLYNDANAFYQVYNSGDVNVLTSEADINAVRNSTDDEYCLKRAFENFKKIVEEYPYSEYYLTSLYYVGHFEFGELKLAESKKHLLEVIESDQSNGYYIRQAFLDLADIAIEEKDYILAQKYIANIENSTPTRFWCGVARNQDEHRVKFIKERLATGLIRK
ncbi:tetratricopeptide repeat protein [Flavobacterium ardleyense]|uniref:tetratricopeptide repeat protein n=1 Tax=Flavobacterium ardleyense TaxID=2038737 RepID=UPI00298BED30|nr:hypothetical protein [Flavobacterium ardleyense]